MEIEGVNLMITTTEHKTWCSVAHPAQTGPEYKKTLQDAGHRVSQFLGAMFDKMGKEVSAELALVNVAELGYPKGGTLSEIYAAAANAGLKPCQVEVGPLVCMLDEDNVGKVLIAIDPILGHEGGQEIMVVQPHQDKRWLDIYHCASVPDPQKLPTERMLDPYLCMVFQKA